MRQVLEEHLKRVEWDEWQFPVRLYPFLSIEPMSAAKPIAIDPKIAFGRLVVIRIGRGKASLSAARGLQLTRITTTPASQRDHTRIRELGLIDHLADTFAGTCWQTVVGQRAA